jgi:hypothetical protein
MSRVLTDAPTSSSTISEANVIAAIQSLTAFSIQSASEAGAGTNTTANILYATSSRTQGNYSIFYAIALSQLTEDLTRVAKTATDAQKEKALAYLIADLQEKKDPDVLAKSVSFDGYSVSRDGMTGSMKAYCAFLDGLPLADSGAIAALQDSDGLIHVRDHDNYPDAWRMTGLDQTSIDPF